MSYDSWLEAPYQRAAADAAAYEDWCDARELDPELPTSRYAYDDYIVDGEEILAERMIDRG